MRTLIAVTFTALFCAGTAATAASLITGKQVKNNSLTGKDIRNRTIRTADLAPSARATHGPTGPQGPAGPQGPKGDTGPAPAPRTVRQAFPQSATRIDGYAVCPHGTDIVSGGYVLQNQQGNIPENADVTVLANEPGQWFDDRDVWRVLIRNDSGQQLGAIVSAVCQ